MGEVYFLLVLGFSLIVASNFLRVWSMVREENEHLKRLHLLIREVVEIQILLTRRERDRARLEALEAQNQLKPRSED